MCSIPAIDAHSSWCQGILGVHQFPGCVTGSLLHASLQSHINTHVVVPFAAALAATAAAVQDGDGGGQRKRTRAERSLYPNAKAEPEEAAREAEALFPMVRAERAAAALTDAYDKVAQRQAARRLRLQEQRQRCVLLPRIGCCHLG